MLPSSTQCFKNAPLLHFFHMSMKVLLPLLHFLLNPVHLAANPMEGSHHVTVDIKTLEVFLCSVDALQY
jgi:hypothetical protein